MFKGASHRMTGTEQCSKEFRMDQCNPERLQEQWAKASFCGQQSGLSSIFQFLATGLFKACLGATNIWPLTLRIFTNSLDQEKTILGKMWPFSESDSGQERFQFPDNDTAPAFWDNLY